MCGSTTTLPAADIAECDQLRLLSPLGGPTSAPTSSWDFTRPPVLVLLSFAIVIAVVGVIAYRQLAATPATFISALAGAGVGNAACGVALTARRPFPTTWGDGVEAVLTVGAPLVLAIALLAIGAGRLLSLRDRRRPTAPTMECTA